MEIFLISLETNRFSVNTPFLTVSALFHLTFGGRDLHFGGFNFSENIYGGNTYLIWDGMGGKITDLHLDTEIKVGEPREERNIIMQLKTVLENNGKK